jgi:hypothetical protein
MNGRIERATKELAENPKAREVAKANPFDKFLLWAAPILFDSATRNLNVRDAEELKWFVELDEKSIEGTALDLTGHAHERNPVIKKACREAYEKMRT